MPCPFVAAPSRRHVAGATRYAVLILVALLAAAGGVIWKIQHDGQEDSVPDIAVVETGDIHRDTAPTTTKGLLQRASAAMSRQHLVAPAGDNAMEWYLRVLQQEPRNRAAQDALREIFPFAATQTEQAMGQADAAEVTRQIDLLARADPSNYTPTLLRAKLQAQQQVADDQQRRDQQLAMAASRPAHAATPATAPVEKPLVVSPATPVAPPAISNAPTPPPAPAPAVATHAAPVPAEPVGETAPVLVRRIEPYYPADARRSRRTGWVDVRFVVNVDGSVSRASVIDADPKNVFDRAALSAVERWQFTPGTRNGTPTASELRQRIEFHL